MAKGKLRIQGYTSTNPLAVGDWVEFTPAAEIVGHERSWAPVTQLHDRRNYLVRKSVNLSHHKHVIASNMDQCFVLVTVARPRHILRLHRPGAGDRRSVPDPSDHHLQQGGRLRR
jgi:ribosome biogenesis GTPase